MFITQQRPAGRWLPNDCFYTLLYDLILFNFDQALFNSNAHLIFNIWQFL